jgi:hypothetical protein
VSQEHDSLHVGGLMGVEFLSGKDGILPKSSHGVLISDGMWGSGGGSLNRMLSSAQSSLDVSSGAACTRSLENGSTL